MNIPELHPWQMGYAQARELQLQMAGQVSLRNEIQNPRLIAGVDVSSVRRRSAVAAVVVLSYPQLKVVEISTATGVPAFPYIPGLLSFREAPLLLAAFARLKHVPDLVLVDGQGYAHPRRFGLACHLGLWLDIPAIGCAKSLLCGNFTPPGQNAGEYSEITGDGEIIGAAMRTQTGIKPVFISIGHKVDLPSAIHWTLKSCRSYRLPEPTRLAHLAAGGHLPLQNT